MKYKNILGLIFMFLSALLIVTFFPFTTQDKMVVLSTDLKSQVIKEENQLNNKIELANKYLNSGSYDNAKEIIEKVISSDRSNKDSYIQIKNCYMNNGRFDDAYAVVKLAISNNVDVDNMKNMLSEIQKKFDVIKITQVVNQNIAFKLPDTIHITINSNKITAEVNWNDLKADTRKIGSFKYTGIVPQYGKTVELFLDVKPPVKEKKIGMVSKVYERNGERYLSINSCQFYRGDQAIEEAKKDDPNNVIYENGKYYVLDDYYLRIVSKNLIEYKISNSATFSVINYESNPISNITASYDDYKKRINSCDCGRVALCWIYTENGIIVKAEMQYTP